MFDTPTQRWAARLVLFIYLWGFLTAVFVMGGLLVQRVWGWMKEKGGWS